MNFMEHDTLFQNQTKKQRLDAQYFPKIEIYRKFKKNEKLFQSKIYLRESIFVC